MKEVRRVPAFIAAALAAYSIFVGSARAIDHQRLILVQNIEEVDYFEFTVCNGTQNQTIYVAVAYRSEPHSSNWTVKGWFPADEEGCSKIGTFPKGKFYFYARSANWSWTGTATHQCIESGFFERPAAESCPSSQLRGFTEADVTEDEYRISLYPPSGQPRFDLDQISE